MGERYACQSATGSLIGLSITQRPTCLRYFGPPSSSLLSLLFAKERERRQASGEPRDQAQGCAVRHTVGTKGARAGSQPVVGLYCRGVAGGCRSCAGWVIAGLQPAGSGIAGSPVSNVVSCLFNFSLCKKIRMMYVILEQLIFDNFSLLNVIKLCSLWKY